MDAPLYRWEDPAIVEPSRLGDDARPPEQPEGGAPPSMDPAHYKQSAIKRGATPVMASVMRGKAVHRSARAWRPLRP
jgi:hypothetical protein